MARRLECDQCGNFSDDLSYAWVDVTIGIVHHDFCGYACLAAWANSEFTRVVEAQRR